MRYLVTITKVAEIEVDVAKARAACLSKHGFDTADMPDEVAVETYVSLAEAAMDIEPEFEVMVKAVSILPPKGYTAEDLDASNPYTQWEN